MISFTRILIKHSDIMETGYMLVVPKDVREMIALYVNSCNHWWCSYLGACVFRATGKWRIECEDCRCFPLNCCLCTHIYCRNCNKILRY
jgi:hypothetical protein